MTRDEMREAVARVQRFHDGAYLVDTYPGNIGALDGLRNDLRTILSMISASPVEDWRPIETAPKDGTHILVTVAHRGGLGYCGPINEHGFRDPADWCDVVHWFDDPDEPGFYATSWGGDQEHPFTGLSHWQPLRPSRALTNNISTGSPAESETSGGVG